MIISGLPESRLLSNYHVIVTPNWLRIIISVLFQVNAEVSANESEKSVYFQNKVLGEGDSFPWYIGQHSFFKALNDLWWQKRQRKKSQFNKRFPGEVGNGKYRVGISFSDYKKTPPKPRKTEPGLHQEIWVRPDHLTNPSNPFTLSH